MGIILGVGWAFHLFVIIGANLAFLAASHLLLARTYSKKQVAMLSALALSMSTPLAWALIDAAITGMPDKTYYKLTGFFDLVALHKMSLLATTSFATLILAVIFRRYPKIFLALCLASAVTTYSALLQEIGALHFSEEIFDAYGFTGHY